MPGYISSQEVEDLLRHFILNIFKEVRPIVSSNHTYQDLQVMFGREFIMPPVEAMRGDVV